MPLTGDIMAPETAVASYLTHHDIAANLPSDAKHESGSVGTTYLLGKFGGAVITGVRLFVADGVSVGVTQERLALGGGFFGTLYRTVDGRAFTCFVQG